MTLSRVSTNGDSGGITPQLIAKGPPGTQLQLGVANPPATLA